LAKPKAARTKRTNNYRQRRSRKLRRADFTRFSLSAFDEGMPASRRLRSRVRTWKALPGRINAALAEGRAAVKEARS
jgi:hypothetical protein